MGKKHYENLRTQIETAENIGKIISINVETGDYEIGDDLLITSRRLQAKQRASTARRKSKVKSQKSKSLCCQLFPDCEWYLYLRRAVLALKELITR